MAQQLMQLPKSGPDHLGMKKAEKGTNGFDGNGRTLQVSKKAGAHSENLYHAVESSLQLADDLLMLTMTHVE